MVATFPLVLIAGLTVSEDSAFIRGLLDQNESQLRVYSCRFEMFVNGELNCSGTYCRDAQRERCLLNVSVGPGTQVDWLASNGRFYRFHPTETPPQLIISAYRQQMRLGDPAVWRLLWSMESATEHRSLTELLSRHPVQEVSRDDEGNVQFTLANFHKTTCVLAARANFAPSRMEVKYKQGGHSVQEVKEFAEPRPGVYFPLRVAGTLNHSGAKESTFEIRFSDITVGQPPPESAFTQTIPEGTRVADEINQVVDVIGPGGTRRRTSLEMVSPDSLGMGKLLRQTEEQGMQVPWIWLATGFASLLLLALWMRRRQLQRASVND